MQDQTVRFWIQVANVVFRSLLRHRQHRDTEAQRHRASAPAPRTPRTSRETNTSRLADGLALRSLRALRGNPHTEPRSPRTKHRAPVSSTTEYTEYTEWSGGSPRAIVNTETQRPRDTEPAPQLRELRVRPIPAVCPTVWLCASCALCVGYFRCPQRVTGNISTVATFNLIHGSQWGGFHSWTQA